jgi:hypothetical protein
VAADASAGSISLGGPASILTFSNGATLATGHARRRERDLQGDGTVTVAGAFHKGGPSRSTSTASTRRRIGMNLARFR